MQKNSLSQNIQASESAADSGLNESPSVGNSSHDIEGLPAGHPSQSLAGYLRLPAVLKLIPVSRSTWYAGIKAGRYPSPTKLGLRVSAYRWTEIRQLLDVLESKRPKSLDAMYDGNDGGAK